jgi:RNA polymerase sigma-70 factor (ECF subfamily)
MTFSEQTDEELASLALGGSQAAFHALVERHTHSIYSLALSITANHVDAEDVVQETFLRVFKHLGSYSADKASFRSWLMTIARNQSINVFGAIKRRALKFFSEFDSEDGSFSALQNVFQSDQRDAESALSVKQQFSQVEEALRKLPERQRTALLLKAQENFSYEEIAQIMETTASSVESLIFRARRKLSDTLEK